MLWNLDLMYKAILFDVGGVLHNAIDGISDALHKELNLTQSQIEEIRSTYLKELGKGAITEAEFWNQIHNKYHVLEVKISEDLLGHAFGTKFEPNIKLLEFIDTLKTTNLTLAVLSNTIEPHARVLRAHGIYDRFENVFLSHEIGMRKPDSSTYKYVLDKLQVKPEEAIFIDDSRDNIIAACKLGIHGIVFSNTAEVIEELSALLLPTKLQS